MADTTWPYTMRLDEKYPHSTVIDVPAEIAAINDEWVNQALTHVNDAGVRLAVIQGEFHWHVHDVEDEFFLVLDGQLLVDVEGQDTVTLDRHQAYVVPSGVRHRTRAPKKTAVLVVSPKGSVPTGTGSPDA